MTEQRIFQIPSPNLANFQARWAKLVKRATKLNVPLPTYTIVKEEPRTITERRECYDDHGDRHWQDVKSVILYHHIQIEHPQVKIDGYTFVASLEHTEEGNIIHNISGIDLPLVYRTKEPWCDHCKFNRRRKDTFVIMSEHGSCQQVGRNCLADFLGRDGTLYAAMAEIYSTASELGEASEGESFGSGGDRFDFLEPFLSHVSEVISHEGWLSRTNAKRRSEETGRNVPATADIALLHMHPSPFQKREDRLYDEPSAKSIEIAKASIAWCENLPDNEVDASEYLSNIRVIARRGIVSPKQYGYAGSIVSGYLRSKAEQANKEKQATSQYVGEIGKRATFNVVCSKVLQFDGAYGSKFLHLMSDEQGNRLIWWSSSSVLDVGVPLTIKATPKKQDEREGVKQTTLTRCSLVEKKS
jgi:hypothetical protein